jgi:uncharacterized membrane protein YcfT
VTTRAKTIDWLDGVKGACMVLVVVLHVAMWYQGAPLGETEWLDISTELQPLRMPTFFLVSGILAQNMIYNNRPKARRRALNLYFVYLLWTALVVIVVALPSDSHVPTIESLIANAVLPTGYWYIWALPVYYLVSAGARRLLGRGSVWLIVPAAFLSFFAHDLEASFRPFYAPLLDAASTTITPVMQNFLWFYLGLVAKVWIVRTFDRARPRTLVLAFVAALGLVIAVRLLPGGATTSLASVGGAKRLLQMLETPGYVVMMLSIFVLLRATTFTRFFNWIGRGTLPVYVFHLWLIAPITVVLSIAPPLASWLGWIVPIVLALAISIACRLIGLVITKSRFRWALNGPFQGDSSAVRSETRETGIR